MSLFVVVITVSDRCAKGEAEDRSGPIVVETIREHFTKNFSSNENETVPAEHRAKECPQLYFRRYCVPDDIIAIQNLVKSITERGSLHFKGNPMSAAPQLIITTGGTGLAARDVTPEALKPLFLKEAPSIVNQMLMSSLAKCSCAWLSRAVAGVIGSSTNESNTLVIALPGSAKAVVECLEPLLETGLLHGVQLAASPSAFTAFVPTSLPRFRLSTEESKPSISAAKRPRSSTYPMVPMEEAYKVLYREAKSVSYGFEKVPLYHSLHRVLAKGLRTTFPHPPFRASIKDGYAVYCGEGENGLGEYEVAGASLAGSAVPSSAPEQRVQKESTKVAWRVNTGGMVPDWADAVVQVEDTELLEAGENDEEARIKVVKVVRPGQDIRPVGCDMKADTEVVQSGTIVSSAEVGIAAAIGELELEVYRKPAVALFSTGDELLDPRDCNSTNGHSLPLGSILDSNKPMLLSAMRELKYDEVAAVEDLGVVRDSLENTKTKIQEALDAADVVISTGGVSMGDVDHVKVAILALGGTIHFGRVNMKPGKPTTFATFPAQEGQRLSKKFFFGLPGNPVSALVCFHLFVVPLLRTLSCLPAELTEDPVIEATLLDDRIILDCERPEYRRCIVRRNTVTKSNNSTDSSSCCPFEVESCGGQASSRLLSLHKANGLMLLPCEGENAVRKKGDRVKVQLLSQIL